MKKEKKILILIMILLTIIPISIFSSTEHGRDVDIIIKEILENSQSGTISEVSPEEVSPALLEELGDVVMGLLLNNDWNHTRMDSMLGGEGSYQLETYHRNLGEQYLLADRNLYELNSYGGQMMGRGMMGFSRYNNPYGSRWNSFDIFPRSNWIWGLSIISGLVILILLAVAIPIVKKRRKSEKQALKILQNRFARGEISQQEYRKMVKIIEY